ncbi:MAG: GntR family transcriptional regulator [Cellulomonas sp.]|jgi:DNA-binding GntR family transcriptional regulator|uniref:GntR family transcriptional regulator n=1 Tax=Cellulomonas sp. TaxID=40001 RepID=UPI0019EC143B|nr:GntR family transcriptional regulator [Cellulomonas sp.]MBF0689479.1 GntR family transcriptional regulator [Cellulomonas sp.]
MPLPDDGATLDRRLLRDDVYRRLRDAIVDGDLAPGEQLRDAELAARLGVSRTPVREALLRLADAGLVVAQPGRSTHVSPVEARDVHDAGSVVAAMHLVAVREAIDRFTPADIEEMREANRRFADAIGVGDVEAALRADDDLHAVPVRLAGNRALCGVLEQYTPVLRRAERLRFSSPAGWDSVVRHEALIERCAAGDGDGAAEYGFRAFASLAVTDG